MAAQSAAPQPGLSTYGGLFFTTLSTLMYEILLTRIFSVTMWYHYAFVAVSVALFGMTVGALAVFLMPKVFAQDQTKARVTQASLAFAVAMVVSFIIQLQIKFNPEWSFGGIASVAAIYLVVSVPFIFSGITVCLILTRFPADVSKLYSVDLIGAGLGTVTVVWLLDVLGDAPSAAIAVALLAAIGGGCFAFGSRRAIDSAAAAIVVLALFGLTLSAAVAVHRNDPLIEVKWVKGEKEGGRLLFERWNAFSRIRVTGDPEPLAPPFSLGISPAYDGGALERRLALTIDATAAATITGYDGDPASLDYLRYEVTNIVHYLRPNASVAIIGTGGGRDVLGALAFGQPSITGIEMNGTTLDVVNKRFGDFTGHLDEQPGVRFVHDEGRSYISRTDQRFDVIHIPFTDTWAATAAGAFALSENSLYTQDAWETFLGRLNPNGVLSVSRWHYLPRPMESYRLTALAAASLRDLGVERPRDHIILLTGPQAPELLPTSVGTILISRAPFTPADLVEIERVTREMQFHLLLTPADDGDDPRYAQIAEARDPNSIDLGFPGDISAPTDDRPFFFQMLRFRDLFDSSLYGGFNDYLAKPVLVLFALSVTVITVTLLFIIVPLLLTAQRKLIGGMAPYGVFFAAIGLAFILVEISQLQRLIIFLGHPTYALSVVLFSLLVFSGIGSLASDWLVRPKANPGIAPAQLWPLGALLAVLVVFGFATSGITHHFDGETTPWRIAIATGILAPMGLLMGMPFPLGMKAASMQPNAPTAFFWGINGATSVCASVLAVAIALGWGISMSFWAGCLCYAIAAIALGYAVLRPAR